MALTTFSDLVQEARERVQRDALAAGLPDDGKPLRDGGTGATAYADAVACILAFGVRQGCRLQQLTLSLGSPTREQVDAALSVGKRFRWPGTFAEANPFCGCGWRSVDSAVECVARSSMQLSGSDRSGMRIRQMRSANQ